MNLPDFNKWSTKMQSEKYLSKYYPDFLNHLNNKYIGINTLKEKIYLYLHNLDHPNTCKICGKYTKYINSNKGYSVYCSSKCSNSDPDKKDLTKAVMLNKYGVENPSQLQEVKEKKKNTSLKNWGVENPICNEIIRNKIKQTIVNKYGVEHPMHNETIRNKIKQTIVNKYGVEHPSQLQEVKEKKKNTSLKNWGVEHPSQLQEVKEKKKNTSLKNWGVEHPMYNEYVKNKVKNSYNLSYMISHPDIINISEEDGERIYTCLCCDKCCELCKDKKYKINHSLYHSRNYQNIEKCTIKNPIDFKSKNTSIEIFIQNILESNNIKYIKNSRIIGNKELDIFIPEKNIGIECNGLYWHSDKIKLPKYHYSKYKLYESSGIQLISIWEDWIKNKPDIVESIINSKFGIYKYRIYARKCIVKDVSHSECQKFLEKNHIQGNSNSSVRLGLYYNDELVSIMCFSKKRRSMMGNKSEFENEWELTRFCNQLNIQIIGGASKLLNYFIKKYNPFIIISFSSHDISNGNLYKTLGFHKEYDSSGTYWYVDDKTLIRYHRYCFRKSELIKKGYDPNLSEFEIMNNLHYTRIYDSGQSKYIWKKKRDQ